MSMSEPYKGGMIINSAENPQQRKENFNTATKLLKNRIALKNKKPEVVGNNHRTWGTTTINENTKSKIKPPFKRI